MTTENTEGTELKITIKASSWTKMERERDEAREALENYIASTVHSCNDECKRPMCVLRRERDEAREKANAMMLQRDEAQKHLQDIKEYGTEEINAAVELRQKLAAALRERDEAMEALSGRTVSCAACNHAAIERDEAREMQSEFKRIIAGLCDERLRLVFENRRLSQERDEARREVDRYREEKDLSPMSWDT